MDFEQVFRNEIDPWDCDSPYEQSKYDETIKMMPIGSFDRVLEIGCAEGHFTSKLARMSGELVAADISPTAISRAKQRDKLNQRTNVRFLMFDLIHEHIPGYFDLIVCSELLYYLGTKDDMVHVVNKMADSILPRGHLIMAHSVCQVDDPDKPGFNWDVPFGAQFICETIDNTNHFALVKEYRTPIYRIHLFQRKHHEYKSVTPEVVQAEIYADLSPSIKKQLDKRIIRTSENSDENPIDAPPSSKSQFAFINDRIAVGNSNDSRKESALLADGITATLSVADDLEPPEYNVLIGEYAGLIAGPGNEVEAMNLAIKTAQKLLEDHNKILIYCHSCRERSPLVTSAVYAEMENIDWREAYATVKERISKTKNYPTFTSKEVGDALIELMYKWQEEFGTQPDKMSSIIQDAVKDIDTEDDNVTTSQLPILAYNRVTDEFLDDNDRYCIRPDIFNAQLENLKSEGYRSIFLDEWLMAIKVKQPLDGKCVALTFDGGYLDFFETVFPILNKHKFNATMFLVADNIGKTNDWDNIGEDVELLNWKHIKQIQRGGMGVQFGSNSSTHCRLSEVKEEGDLEYQIKESRRKLEGGLFAPVRLFSYPYGDVTDEASNMIGESGYEIGVTCHEALSTFEDDPMRLPRIEIHGGDTMEVFQKKLILPSIA